MERRSQGIETLSGPDEIKFRSMSADLEGLSERLNFEREELRRCGSLPPGLAPPPRTHRPTGAAA
jgi:hypothetical protein